MKSLKNTVLFASMIVCFMLALFFATTASAGILGAITGRFDGVGVTTLVSIGVNAFFAILALFLGSRVKKFKTIVKEGVDCGVWLIKSTSAESDGGKKITQKELEDGAKEFGEFGAELVSAVKAKSS